MDITNKYNHQNHKPANYAFNGKIMLCSVIILFIVIFTIACFHSYVRCFFHRHHPRRTRRTRRTPRYLFPHPVISFTTLLETTLSPTNPKALDPSVLKTLPTFTYSATTRINPAPLECAVCLSEFEDEEQGRVLPRCNHTFHLECIDTWFQSQSNCPLCRAPVQPDIPLPRLEISPETAITVNEPGGSEHETAEAKVDCSRCLPSTSGSAEEYGRKPIMEVVEEPKNATNQTVIRSLDMQRERTRTMNPVAAAPFVFLSTLSVLQFVLVAGHESQGTNGGSKAGVVNMNLIQQACQHAPHKDLCINTLKNDPNSKGADLTGLAYIAIRLAGAYASEVDAHLRSLLINNATTLSPVVQQGVADCIEHYSDANEQLDDCVAAMSTKNYKDVEVWVNVAISDADYCDNSFSGEKSVVLQKNEAFRQLCNNVLAVVKALPPHGKE